MLTIKERIIRPAILQAIYEEIDFLRNHPRKRKISIKKLDVRDPHKCFVGQAFNEYNKGFILHEGIIDAKEYRQKIGGFVFHQDRRGQGETLLEIWGEHHFAKHKKLCQEIAKYINEDLEKCPEIIIDNQVSIF